MAKFLVQKSEPLNGEVVISGAKNAVLPLMAVCHFGRGQMCNQRRAGTS